MPSGSVNAFRPNGTTALSTSSVSTNVPLTKGGDTVVVTNTSSLLAYIRFGADGGVIASLSDMPVLPNSRIILSVNPLISYAAAITPAGSGTILFSRGDGSFI